MPQIRGKRAAVHNLGCKVNSCELDAMTDRLRRAGCIIVPFHSAADIYVINTCTVTNIADRKSRQMLHRAKAENPDAIVVAVGCYVETDKDRIRKDPCVDLAIGNDRKGEIAEILEAYFAALPEETGTPETDGRSDSGSGCGRGKETAPPVTMHRNAEEDPSVREHTRAYIKIQDGCSQYCTYCIIPYARGKIRSRQVQDILNEIMALSLDGVKEVVLTGIHISSFGRDRGEDPAKALLELMRRIQLISGIHRIRLGSLEPRIITEDFVQGMAGLSKLCPHFHLSLQSGCNATLRRMNRHYTAEEYYEKVEMLRRHFDRPAITTDIITGFAGETEEEFRESLAFAERVRFYEIHVFRYSVRRGTAAASFPHQNSETVKAARSAAFLDLTQKQAAAYRRQFLGQREEILAEEPVTVDGNTFYRGYTKRYVEGLVPAQPQIAPGELISGRFVRMTDGAERLVMETEPS